MQIIYKPVHILDKYTRVLVQKRSKATPHSFDFTVKISPIQQDML